MTQYDLLVTRINGHYEATMIGLPSIHAQAPTRQEAIERAKQVATRLLAASEVIGIELDLPTPTPSLAELGGMWKDNELFDEFINAMNANRREIDARNA